MTAAGVGFRTWLNRQADRDDPVGDLARDLREDTCAKGLRSRASLGEHLEHQHHAIDPALHALDRAWREWGGSR